MPASSPITAFLLINLLPLIAMMPSYFATEVATNNAVACDAQQFAQMPCRCCKMDCWYSVARSATHQLGHVPGQEGEEEALATLRLIRACMITECSSVCAPFAAGMMKKRRFPAIIGQAKMQ